MGNSCDWKCSNHSCNKIVEQVGGGKDRGFYSLTETRVCTHCADVCDYQIGVASDPTHRMYTEKEHAEAANPDPECRKCRLPTKPWDRRCPDCGFLMKIDPLGTRIMWD